MTRKEFLDSLYELTISGKINWIRNGISYRATGKKSNKFFLLLMGSMLTIKCHEYDDKEVVITTDMDDEASIGIEKLYVYLNENMFYDDVINWFSSDA